MTPKEKMAYALLVGVGAIITTYVTMSLREQIDTWNIG